MTTRFESVSTPEQVAEVARLARAIWLEHYVPIVGREQIDYMLETCQSPATITRQLSQNHAYWLVECDGQWVGYLAVAWQAGDDRLMLSKIYLDKAFRGRGLGGEMLEFVESLARRRGCASIWLTVNKDNAASIAWYERMGFVNAGPLVQDIGGGFVMDDYKMEKSLPFRTSSR